ncbi:MAG: HAD hydrolase family protein [Fervidicoccaceae archaeon]
MDEKLKFIEVVAADIDGTITRDRSGYELSIESIAASRLLRLAGLDFVLVTANSLPVALGLGRYLGASGVVAENGCVVARVEPSSARDVVVECEASAIDVAREAALAHPEALRESWQNIYRECDAALIAEKSTSLGAVVELVERFLKGRGLSGRYKISASGYAVHITPRDCSKALGLKKYLELVGLSLENAMCIADSAMDVDFIAACGVAVAVSNSDDELKKVAHWVTDSPSARGFLEAIERLIEFKLSVLRQSPFGRSR